MRRASECWTGRRVGRARPTAVIQAGATDASDCAQTFGPDLANDAGHTKQPLAVVSANSRPTSTFAKLTEQTNLMRQRAPAPATPDHFWLVEHLGRDHAALSTGPGLFERCLLDSRSLGVVLIARERPQADDIRRPPREGRRNT